MGELPMPLPETAVILRENCLFYFAEDRGIRLILEKKGLKTPVHLMNGQHNFEFLGDVVGI